MPKAAVLIFVAAFIAVIVIVALSGSSLVEGFDYKENMPAAAISTITALIAVSLFVERGMTVVNAILYGEKQRTIELSLAPESARSMDQVQRDQVQRDLAQLYTDKERSRLLGAFIAAVFVSAAGVRTLEGLLDTKAAGHPVNGMLIPVDVILTALLIAGGSNGLAFLLWLAKERLGSGGSQATQAQPQTRGAAAAQAPGINPAVRARLITSG